jgi:hypothetical protein
MPNATPTRYRTPKQSRPLCPRHGCLLRVETSKGVIAYAYCPRQGCGHSAKVLRQPVGEK